MKTAELALALAGTGLSALLCLVLFLRGSYRQYRIFSAYIAFSVISAVAAVAVRNMYSFYFYEYWVSEAFYVLLAFFAVQEAFHSVFRNFHTMGWFRFLFPGIGILMLGIAILRIGLHPAPEGKPLIATLISLEIAVGFLQFGLFCLFILLVRFFHMRWRQHALGIGLGFGIAGSGSLVVFLLRSEFGTQFDPVVRITPPIGYIVAVSVWLATFLRGEPYQPTKKWDSTLTPEQMIAEVRRYTKAVKGILGR
jgi:hypothetical protein